MPNNTPIPDAELAELRRLHGEAQKTTWQAGAAREIYAAFPALLARLEAAEKDRDNLEAELESALAASPADHERRLKAEALRSTAAELEVLRDYIQTEVGPDDARDDIRRICWNRAKDLREEADRLEAENGR